MSSGARALPTLLESLAEIPDGHRLSTLHEHMSEETDDESGGFEVEK
ncbi:hypothetical protein [Halapricum salinum]|nr:hypothetical protein [Halapricum salinum]